MGVGRERRVFFIVWEAVTPNINVDRLKTRNYLSFYRARLLHRSDRILAVMILRQHRVRPAMQAWIPLSA